MTTPLGHLLEGQEDRGVSAVMSALRSLRVASWNPEQQAWTFHEQAVTGEALQREVDRALGRRT